MLIKPFDTSLSLRSTSKKILTSVIIVMGALAFFGALVAFDSRKKNVRSSTTVEPLKV